MLETTGIGVTGEIRSRLDDNSLTKKALQWMFKANQAGILDPDSATQKWDTVNAKYTDGSVFFAIWEWATMGYNTAGHVGAANPRGYAQVLTGDMRIPIQPDALVGSNSRFMAIGAGTKNIDAALAYLNHFYSVEGQELLFNLPEGVIWEKGGDGLGHVRDQAWQYLDNDAAIPAIGGSKAGDAQGIINFRSISDAEISPITGQFMERNLWPETIAHNTANNNLFKRWSAANNGASSYYDLITSAGRSVKVNFASTLVPAAPQEIQPIITQIGSVLKTNFWRMVFAANEAEFEALWKDAQSKAETLGMPRILNWARTAWAQAQAGAASYQ
jgi:putative aldouronate transport system substrate-binding protein